MTTTLVSVLLRSNLEWMSILRLMLQTPIADHHSSRDKALDREDGSQLLAKAGRQARCSCELGDSSSCESKPASFARVCDIRSSNDHHTSVSPSSQQSGVDEHPEAYAANTYSRPPQRRETRHLIERWLPTPSFRKLEGKLDAFVNLVTHLAANRSLPLFARVCGIRSSNDHHTSVYPSSQQSGVDEHPEAYAANTIAPTTTVETRHLIEKMAPNS
ncbi:hypothetical protein Fmac_015304 [Flemingia macrophylla]|uniref:Uncharacterized protein n=1 Tax=Flemingia macrophylla TaxID=520843 RepID=A0ABD1ME68_9FABA